MTASSGASTRAGRTARRRLRPSDLRVWTPVVIAVVLTIVRVVLAYQTPVSVLLGRGTDADDALFAGEALSLARGRWLGSYGLYTLAKNPGYPLIMAFCGVTHLRYQLVLIGLHVCACATFACALRPRVGSRWLRVVAYLLLLYTPLLFTTTYFRRIYRDGMVIPFALGTLSSYIGWYLRRNRPLRSQVPWALLAVAYLVPLSLVKENFAWALPFVVVCSLVILAGWVLGARGKAAAARRRLVLRLLCGALLLALPFVGVRLADGAVASINYRHYGSAVTNERFSGSFSRVCSDLSAIDAGNHREGVWVSRATLRLAEQASPTLASMSDELDEAWDVWSQQFDGQEVFGDLAYWALREAYGNARGYRSAARTSAYWEAVAKELDRAIDAGRLPVKGGLRVSQVAPPITRADVAPWLGRTGSTVVNLLGYTTMQEHLVGPTWTSPDPAPQRLDEELAARRLLGGNTLLNGTTDSTPERTAAVSTVDWYLGRSMIALQRVLSVALVPALLALLVLCGRGRVARPLEVVLVCAGLALTALVFEAATVWYVSYQLAIFSTESYLLEVYKYSPEFYVVISMLECFVFVELAGLEKFHVREDSGHALVDA